MLYDVFSSNMNILLIARYVGIGLAHAKLGDYEAAWKDFYTVTNEIHDNNEAALANQKIMMDAVKGKKK